jgi:Na+-translocating ferredoxin:NAD+ oxidoreductase RnfC subunit
LCTLYACPEQLYPKEACDASKAEMRKANLKWNGSMTVKEHPMHDGRRIPIKTLARKLSVEQYDHPAPFVDFKPYASRFVLPLKQSAGAACLAKVRSGDSVRNGQVIGEAPAGAMGATLHAPVDAKVLSISEQNIVLER